MGGVVCGGDEGGGRGPFQVSCDLEPSYVWAQPAIWARETVIEISTIILKRSKFFRTCGRTDMCLGARCP